MCSEIVAVSKEYTGNTVRR